MSASRWSIVLLAVLLAGSPGATGADPLQESLDAVVTAAREHRVALERLLGLHEADATRAEQELARRRDLAARDLIARRDVAAAESRAQTARTRVEETKQEIARVDTLVAEARAAVALARMPPPAPGEERHGEDHVVFGGGPWSLARVAAIEQFFASRFGRKLPVSALGQTPLHDRLGFDHRHALDVALHPDTPEGRALLDYLRHERIPFIAFRSAERGVATGAHVHIGEPSSRKSIRRAQIEDRHGSAGAVRANGGVGAMSGPPR